MYHLSKRPKPLLQYIIWHVFFTKVSCNNLSDRFSSLEKVFCSELKIPLKYSPLKSCSSWGALLFSKGVIQRNAYSKYLEEYFLLHPTATLNSKDDSNVKYFLVNLNIFLWGNHHCWTQVHRKKVSDIPFEDGNGANLFLQLPGRNLCWNFRTIYGG